jgi:hypothetical protein
VVARTAGYDTYVEETQHVREMGVRNAAKQTVQHVAKRFILKRLSPWLYSITLSICFLQFVFAAISLVGFALQGVWAYMTEETYAGRIAGWMLDAVSFIFDLGSIMPVEYLGMTFYSLSLIVGFIGFVGFIIFFHLLGIDMLRSTVSTLVLALCLALTVLPVSNLLPWLFLWVLYVVNAESSVSYMAHERGPDGL